jgi:hypothetical protein
MGSPQEAVQIVRAVKQFIEAAWRFYEFTIHPELSKTGTCPECSRYAQLVMTRTEIEARFPDLEKVSDTLWKPHIHPNCNCELWFEEEETEEEVLKDNRWKK